jgi:cytochrome b involved in lipid metabolism
MVSRSLPTISLTELEKHSSAKSCYVTIGSKVCDVTAFLSDHPGGEDLILEFVPDNNIPFFFLNPNMTEDMPAKT